MPLDQSPSNKARSSNIGEIVKSYKQKGTIGTSTPKSDVAAQKQAEAIAFATQRKNK